MITIDNLDYIVRDVAFKGLVLNHYKNLREWSNAHNSVCDFLTLWKKNFLLNTYHNKKPLMWWF